MQAEKFRPPLCPAHSKPKVKKRLSKGGKENTRERRKDRNDLRREKKLLAKQPPLGRRKKRMELWKIASASGLN